MADAAVADAGMADAAVADAGMADAGMAEAQALEAAKAGCEELAELGCGTQAPAKAAAQAPLASAAATSAANAAGNTSGNTSANAAGKAGANAAGKASLSRSAIIRILCTALGLLTLALGTIGIFVPLLPTTPFYLLSAFCFAKGSSRLNRWFVGTAMYRRYIESYVKGQGMTLRTKITIMVSVTVLLGVSFFFTWGIHLVSAMLLCIWAAHAFFLFFRVKTLRGEQARP
jgi:uncharacterized membrane protein YbaN (DUF454 family)